MEKATTYQSCRDAWPLMGYKFHNWDFIRTVRALMPSDRNPTDATILRKLRKLKEKEESINYEVPDNFRRSGLYVKK